MARDNKEIGRFDLTDLPPAPRGVPQIEVAFDIDADGILHVSAKDKQTGKEQKIKIEAKSGLTDAEIQRKIKEAELHAAEDKVRKEMIETRNEADALAFRSQKSLSEFKDKLPAQVTSDIQSSIDALKKALEGDDQALIKAKTGELQEKIQKIGEELAKQGGAADANPSSAQPGASAQSSKNKGDIEDAEVEIVDDKK
jgi:molecular chaperone DnaK